MKPFNLLSSLLDQIEQDSQKKIKIKDLALQYYMSDVHLQRLFKFVFGIPLASYIRSRRLALSIESLFNTDLRIIDIAMNYGFDYERTYIRAFSREYGITPGEYRKSRKIMQIMPPLKLHDKNKLGEGLLYGPDIVMVPGFHVVGRIHKINFIDAETPIAAAKRFEQDMSRIPNVVDPNIYIGLTRINAENWAAGNSQYLTSVQVNNLNNIPEGFIGDSFSAALCTRFRYVGEHHYRDITLHTAKQMYDAIDRYANSIDGLYSFLQYELYFERVDLSAYDGKFCQMEWFAPLKNK